MTSVIQRRHPLWGVSEITGISVRYESEQVSDIDRNTQSDFCRRFPMRISGIIDHRFRELLTGDFGAK